MRRGLALARGAISIALCLALVSPAAARSFSAQCLSTPDGKKVPGQITIGEESIRFRGSSFSQQLPTSGVTKITAGEFAKRRVKGAIAGAVLLAPVALFALIGKKKREMFALEYEDESGEARVLIFQVKKRFGFPVETALEVATGLEVEWQEERAPAEKKEE